MQEIEWKLKSFKVKDLKPFEKNTRIISKHDYNELKKSVERFGMVDKPICTQDGLLMGGHQRLRVLKALKVDFIDCWVPSRELTDKEFEEANIRFNRNRGEFDFDALSSHFEVEDLIDWGFTANDFDIDLSSDDQEENTPDSIVNEKIAIEINCETSKEQEELYAELKERGYTCKVIKR